MKVQIALRKFWLAVPLCLLIVVNLPAQESYFPHHLGDMWEYYVVGDNLFEIMQVIVISDSVGQDSFSYFHHYRQYINPPRPTPIPWWENFWQDTSANIFASGLGSSSRLMYKLNASIGNLWIVEDFGGGYDIARVEDIYPDTLFGIPTTVKGIAYYGAQDTSDTTTWLVQYGELLAKGFGTIFRGGGDLAIYYQMYLKGAVIDSVVYGDTTLVAITQPTAGILPHQFQLFRNYPNPFNPNTTIPFILSRSDRVTLTIYNLNGKEVIKLIDEQFLSTGEYDIEWNGKNQKGGEAASGVYFYQLKTGNRRLTRQMLKIK